MHLQRLERQALATRGIVRGDRSMNVKCQSCDTNGQVSDEALSRTVLWVCNGCSVRYLVSSRGMRKAPTPPPPPRPLPVAGRPRPQDPVGESAPKPAPASASAPEFAQPVHATARADGWLADMAGEPKETPASSALPLLNVRASTYPVMHIRVNDPLWRRPALLASAVAGLLVGLAAYGMRFTREQAANYTPTMATAAVAHQESGAPATPHENEASPVVNEVGNGVVMKEPARPPARSMESTKSHGAEAQGAEALKPSRRTRPHAATRSQPARAARAEAFSSTAPPIAASAAAVQEPQPEVLSKEAQPKAEAQSLSEAMTIAAEQREAPGAGEPQAKAQPASTSNGAFDGYTPFSRDSALSALSVAATSAARCRSTEGPFGTARVAVTFAPNGNVTTAVVEGPPFAGTPVGSCIALTFREARVSPFSGAPVTVRKSVRIF